ncbi:MAG: Bax inhibitor-1 family protein [Planctomycetota bacterium]
MTHSNPYASLTAPPAAFAAASERATFLKKVYGLLLLGVLGFAATLWAAANVPVANDLAIRVGRMIYGTRFGWAIYMGIFFAGSWAVNAVAEKKPLNAFAYAAWVVTLGFLVAPLVLIINQTQGVEVITQASTITALVFGGLTAFVLYTGKDFSFLRGMLGLVGIVLMVVFVVGMLMGFTFGLWVSAVIVALSAGYILYYTSTILHRLPTTMAMSGAILLFTEVVLLFKHILILLARSRD